ncbi:hypothetical protein [Streptomyces decoyicus]|uniref:hypothetical protein n=1 Tax=Streptomyces decoyicus TaxID=249567 RepID=UPI002F9111DC
MTTHDPVPPLYLDSPEGSRYLRTQYVRNAIEAAGEKTAVVDALTNLVEAFHAAAGLHEGKPAGVSKRVNLLAYLDSLTQSGTVEDLPRISNPPLCSICTHERAHHYTDPTTCTGCQGAEGDAWHEYTQGEASA